ncbi:ABC transporter substrate-binding protein [Devosia algicola]|uniref:ABC transporter substrate-binding protein n=1 Tax=Devosia algicola TaxID=3026418 RepID=A0ABY7YQ87_9HYPH|nr:ABC transporter substrate-binding protein [Devosia algicola]WDR03060.1 ABC transporter substrate-binding protein [Devosia algicola]
MRHIGGLLLVGLALAVGGITAQAQDNQVDTTVIVGAQESGTVQWELQTIKTLALDKKHHVKIVVRPLADSRAGQIALLTGTVDVILSDFVWVSVQREQGNLVTMVPHSLAVGGLMVPKGSTITTVADLKGGTVGVAGGPVDKSLGHPASLLQSYHRPCPRRRCQRQLWCATADQRASAL